ncbi:hypothetical protein ACFQX8_02930 [Klenkia terrae]|uniref:hypothetical protein n=1 Tax=Klenkia terrae TaxID=1052259 RepID=UPI00361E68FC
MLFSSRRADDADVIRARLRALLDEGGARRGGCPTTPTRDRAPGLRRPGASTTTPGTTPPTTWTRTRTATRTAGPWIPPTR